MMDLKSLLFPPDPNEIGFSDEEEAEYFDKIHKYQGRKLFGFNLGARFSN